MEGFWVGGTPEGMDPCQGWIRANFGMEGFWVGGFLGGRDPSLHLPTHPQALPTMSVAKEVDKGGKGMGPWW